jgi:hypothetical protein
MKLCCYYSFSYNPPKVTGTTWRPTCIAYLRESPATQPTHSHSKRKLYLYVTNQQSEKKSLDFDQTALTGGLVYSFNAVLLKYEICASFYLPLISHTTAVFVFWATLNWDTEKTQCVLCKRSKDSFTGFAFVLFETISLTIFMRKLQKLWLPNCKSKDNTKATVSQSLRSA